MVIYYISPDIHIYYISDKLHDPDFLGCLVNPMVFERLMGGGLLFICLFTK